jgi:hypothetical protein
MRLKDNDQIIENTLSTMLQRIGDGNQETRDVRQQVESLKTEYEKERAEAKKDPKKEKDFERYQNSLAGALPGITKGTLDAITAFQQTPPDIIVGSAAVVDICASLASALGGLSALGGPPGALVGAMFSMVSMILGFFAPTPPSLISQIEQMMRDLRGETEKSEIKSAEEAIFVYKDNCDKYMKPVPGGGVQDPSLLTRELEQFNLVEGNTIKSVRTVRQWLLEEGNWDLDGWPEILNLLCQVYMHLMLAITRQNLYAHDEKWIADYVGSPPNFERVHKWELLQLEVKIKLGNLESNNRQQRAFLRQILPVARARGTFVLAHSHGSGLDVFAATGRKALRNGAWGTPIYEGCRRVSVVPLREGADYPNARYDIWFLDPKRGKYAVHNQLAVRSRRLTNSQVVGANREPAPWPDCWPMPQDNGMYRIYATLDWAEGGALAAWTWSPNDPPALHRMDWQPLTGKKATWLRVIDPSVMALPDDPDGPSVHDQTLFYATLKDSREIYVLQNGTGASGWLTVPMASYRGVAVDPYCVWIFGDHGVVGATHASVQATLLKKRSSPNWLGPPQNNKSSIVDVSECGDGTLTVISGSELFNGLYRIDFAKENPQDKLTVEWEKWGDLSSPQQLQKLPVLGWPLLDASIQSLTGPAPDLVRPSFLIN